MTTTGATTLSNRDTAQRNFNLESFLQWLGGIGIVVIALFILPFLRIGGMQLFHLEGDDPYDKSLPKISSVIKKIFVIYATLTVALIFFYYICGMMPFDAISHSFTTISTGGFPYDSFAFFNNDKFFNSNNLHDIRKPSFFSTCTNFEKNLFAIFKDHQVRVFILILL